MRSMMRMGFGVLVLAACKSAPVNAPAAPPTTTIPVDDTAATSNAARTLSPANLSKETAATEAAPTREGDDVPSATEKKKLGTCGLEATLRPASPHPHDGRYKVTLKNTGASALRLVLPGDGSDVGWRTPILTWSATANGAPVAPVHGPRCGFMNGIEPSEIVTLAPGASREIIDWIAPPPFPSGNYDVRLTYRNDPEHLGRATDASEQVKELIAKSSACEITTNALHTSMP